MLVEIEILIEENTNVITILMPTPYEKCNQINSGDYLKSKLTFFHFSFFLLRNLNSSLVDLNAVEVNHYLHLQECRNLRY